MLTSRETATLILLGSAIVVYAVVPRLRHTVGPSVVALLRTLVGWRILVSLGALLSWIVGSIAVGYLAGLWNWGLFKDSIVLFFTLAVPALVRVIRTVSGAVLVRDLIRDAAGITALSEFYLNVEPFPLWAELLIQPVAIFTVILNVYAAHQATGGPVRRFTSGLLVIIGLGSLTWTTVHLVQDWGRLDLFELSRSLFFPIWLSLLLLPFLYLFGFYALAESALVRMALARTGTRRLPAGVRVAVVLGLHFRISLAAALTGRYINIGGAGGYHEARDLMRAFRAEQAAV